MGKVSNLLENNLLELLSETRTSSNAAETESSFVTSANAKNPRPPAATICLAVSYDSIYVVCIKTLLNCQRKIADLAELFVVIDNTHLRTFSS